MTDRLGRLVKGLRYLHGPRLLLVSGLAFVVLALVIAFGVYRMALAPVRPGSADSEIVAVPYGHSTTQIADLLETKGLIRSARAFRRWTVVSGTSGSLHAGEYTISYGMSTPQIVARMARGQVVLHPITIPEGYNAAQIAALLEQRGFADQARFHEALRSAANSGLLPAGFASSRPAQVRFPLEGYLFPDTYHVYRGITEGELVRIMVGRFKAAMSPALEERARELKLTPSQVITLASIIEREARAPEERPVISGVFHNRLRIGMKLDADPTVRYAMPDPTRPITSKELAIDSPYNTYVNAGLPPGPICSPGLASIEAALYPAQVNYLYFVAKPDGTHAFSRTFAEHLRNVALYIK
ncbi:MAG: endolytic transglycosylase MltG [Bacillota bacterium]|nr:endolytic transglycosylase MltG [Bacillota bacterium]